MWPGGRATPRACRSSSSWWGSTASAGPAGGIATCVSDPSGVSLAALRERPGTLLEWTLHTGYHTVHGM